MSRVSVLALAVLLFACADRDPAHACSARDATAPCTRVLFIGNSYTFANDLPGMFTTLARATGHNVITHMSATGGATLGLHASAATTKHAIDSLKWDFVVIQEQSQIPAVEPSRSVAMYPAARMLVSDARAVGAKPLLFVTWARQQGWPERGLPDYAGMQAAIDSGYAIIGSELSVPLVAVGDAWAAVTREHPEIVLWNADGSHPTANGTYLAACAFYAAVFGQSAGELPTVPGVEPAVARILQTAAGVHQ